MEALEGRDEIGCTAKDALEAGMDCGGIEGTDALLALAVEVCVALLVAAAGGMTFDREPNLDVGRSGLDPCMDKPSAMPSGPEEGIATGVMPSVEVMYSVEGAAP